MQKSFEKLAVLDFADEYCENHTFSKGGQVTVKPVRMMIDKMMVRFIAQDAK